MSWNDGKWTGDSKCNWYAWNALNAIDIQILGMKRLECLFVGIGVDDIFVIVQAWSNLAPEICQTQPIQERLGLTLKHAVSYKRCSSYNNFF